ncbi:MAG: class I SAM-dependent methyltransferase [Firmicutes bacterium]|nr:class I SAM-dependent methyltransferase [Bacillota bacterium]
MEKYFGTARQLLEQGLATEITSYDENNTYDTAIQFTEDLEFYLELARGRRVLDIGCGTGRVMLPLLQAGVDVTGIDMSPHMLKLAAEKLNGAGFTPELHQGDMRDFNLESEFDLIIIPYYSMTYMHSDAERSTVLNCCWRHLASGGMLAFDFDAGTNETNLSKPWLGFEKIDPNSGDVTIQTVQMNQVDPHLRIINMITYRINGSASRIDVNASVEASIPAPRMQALLEATGFSVQEFYQDYQYTPYAGGEECVVVAKKDK